MGLEVKTVEGISMGNLTVFRGKAMAYLPFLRERPGHYLTLPDSEDIATQLLGIPKPRFKLGDKIKYSFICDDQLDTESYGQLITLSGIVLWMIPDLENKRWQYCIMWDGQRREGVEFYVSGEDQSHLELA